ncbi:MAG: polysaccharide deacetylase, partial [Clostridium sp.]|nr:polysaccharide deacetylase [Clostridium sp.]
MRNDSYINRNKYYRSRRRRRGGSKLPYLLLGLLLLILLGIAGWLFFNHHGENGFVSNSTGFSLFSKKETAAFPASEAEVNLSSELETDSADSRESGEPAEGSLEACLADASLLAAGYDYDGAITLLTESPYASSPEAAEAISEYENTKSTLVRIDPTLVTHVFFHTLIMDTSKAFDGDRKEKGYNQVMTTKEEFMKILQSMYDRGFVLVRLHDIAYETTDENGSPHFTQGDIMLPPGKQPFVMSQDDVCYYEYMEGDGFASRMIVGEDGKPTCEMKMDDGSVAVG